MQSISANLRCFLIVFLLSEFRKHCRCVFPAIFFRLCVCAEEWNDPWNSYRKSTSFSYFKCDLCKFIVTRARFNASTNRLLSSWMVKMCLNRVNVLNFGRNVRMCVWPTTIVLRMSPGIHEFCRLFVGNDCNWERENTYNKIVPKL